jgi:hydroxymethylpyrimidine kinase/phosphomethylpyrimidine kinase/thiamine-phosphate diphosphorylase
MNPLALTIAGADPSGGAGIQADLRTFLALGVDGISAITAVTAQNSLGVTSVHPVESDILAAQLNVLLSDMTPTATKIGMLGEAAQVNAVSEVLGRQRLPNIVLDPVLASSGGVPLLDIAGRFLLLTALMPLCALITPNIDEAAALSGMAVTDEKSMILAGEKLISLGARAVLVKGGHLNTDPSDWLIQRHQEPIRFPGVRIDTKHTHGTGCLLSSAIAANLAKGKTLADSVASAKVLLSAALALPIVHGQSRGYPNVQRAVVFRTAEHAERMRKFHGLYVVTDAGLQQGRSHLEVARAALAGGAQIIQLRDKSLETQELVRQAKELCALVHDQGKLFIINDRVDIALAADADGVHLGPDDLSPADVRRLLGPDKLVGISTGTIEEAIAAAPNASYFGVGAVFGSKTKLNAGAPITPQRITEIKSKFPKMPVVAIGGINAGNIRSVIEAGADSAAVVSAVVAAADIEQAARELVDLLTLDSLSSTLS